MSLGWEAFARILLDTEDLDPVYTMLHRSGLDLPTKKRFCLSYWCFYHVGIAARCAEKSSPEEFWREMKRWLYPAAPRGAERRHFRGSKAVKAVRNLSVLGPPETIVDSLFSSPEYSSVAREVGRLPMFGPWITWKIADMGERVLGFKVDFSSADLSMYRDPVQGAAQILLGDWKMKISKEEIRAAIQLVLQKTAGLLAPPARDRGLNVQEVETIFCKYKSHAKGHYHPGKDSRECREKLRRQGPIASLLLQSLPKC